MAATDKLAKFNNMLDESYFSSLNNYFEEFEGGFTGIHTQQACYAALNRKTSMRKGSKYVAVSTRYFKEGDSVFRRFYFKYLMKEHPLSHLYYKTSLKFADKEGMIVKTSDSPNNQG